jgi:hypothetical protein
VTQESNHRPRGRESLFDCMTMLLVIGSVVMIGGTLLILANPDVPFNPLPPPTEPVLLQFPSLTPTPTITNTPTITLTPTITDTPTITPTFTPSMTFTPSNTPPPSFTPTYTPTVTTTPTSVLPGIPTRTPNPNDPSGGGGQLAQPGIVIPTGSAPLNQDANAPFPFTADPPIYQPNTNPQGCDWLSIAGTVTGLLGEPILNLAVEVSGEGFTEVQFTGTAPLFGASGFEVNLGSEPQAQDFAVRILGSTGEPLSDYISVTTGSTCEENVLLLPFRQVKRY